MKYRIHKGTIICFVLGLLSLALFLPATKNFILDLYESFRGYPLRLRDEWYDRLSRFCVFIPCIFFVFTFLYQFFVKNVVSVAQNTCQSLFDYVKQEQRQVVFVVLISLIFGVIAHGFGFSNLILSHDSLYLRQGDIFGQLELGRFLQPVYVYLFRGIIVTPYLITLFAFCFLVLTNLVVIVILDIKEFASIILTCGLMVTNLVVTLLIATYVNYVDLFMLSLLLSVLAVFVTYRYKHGVVTGIVLLVLSMGLYQAYIQVAVCLFLFLILRLILRKEEIRKVLQTGIKYISVLLSSLILYYVVWKFLLFVTGTHASDSYNGLTGVGHYEGIGAISSLLGQTYWFVGKTFLFPKNFHSNLVSVLNVCIIVLSLIWVIRYVLQRKVRGWSLFVLIVVMAIFPFGIGVVYFISKGLMHDLMIYSFFFVYIFALVGIKRSRSRLVVRFAIGVILFCNVVFANQIYVKKHLEFEGSLAVMARVLDRIEQVPEYVAGVTPVIFVGDINNGPLAVKRVTFSHFYDGTGLGSYYSLTYDTYAYAEEILGYPLIRGDISKEFVEQDVIDRMEYFPALNSCQLVDGVIVVKFSDPVYYD